MGKQRSSNTDYFISYASADSGWANWIGWVIEEEGRSVVMMEWDFAPGRNFVLEMDRATRESSRTIAILSPNYLASHYTHAEWAAAFAGDPKGEEQTLLPIRVEECVLEGLLAQVVYVDLVGKSEAESREAIAQLVQGERLKPVVMPAFPGSELEQSPRDIPGFPTEYQEGFLDLVDRGVIDLKSGNRIASDFALNVQELGQTASDHAAKFNAVAPGPGRLQAYRVVSRSAARGMNAFCNRAELQVREMAVAYESGFGAWNLALEMLPEFGEPDANVIRGNQESLEGVLNSIPPARMATAGLRDVVQGLPRVDGVFAMSRTRTARVLDEAVRALDRVEYLARRVHEQGGALVSETS